MVRHRIPHRRAAAIDDSQKGQAKSSISEAPHRKKAHTCYILTEDAHAQQTYVH